AGGARRGPRRRGAGGALRAPGGGRGGAALRRARGRPRRPRGAGGVAARGAARLRDQRLAAGLYAGALLAVALRVGGPLPLLPFEPLLGRPAHGARGERGAAAGDEPRGGGGARGAARPAVAPADGARA